MGVVCCNLEDNERVVANFGATDYIAVKKSFPTLNKNIFEDFYVACEESLYSLVP